MGRKGVSKQKPSKSKIMRVSKTNVHKSEFLVPKMLNKGEAISISKDGKKISSEVGKKKKKR